MRTLFSILFFLFAFLGTIKANDITIAEDWKIHVEPNAHQEVTNAARDLQNFLCDRLGLELNIVEMATGPGIYLSVNEKIKNDGFSMNVNAYRQRLVIEYPSPRALYQRILVLEDHLLLEIFT